MAVYFTSMEPEFAASEGGTGSAADRQRAAKASAGRNPKARKSRIANGSSLLPTASGSSVWARLMRDTLANLMSHLGGADLASETQKLASRRVSFLEAELIYLENEIATTRQEGGEPDPNKLDLYGRLADRQRRLADPLGWQRTARHVGPSLSEVFRQGVLEQQQQATPVVEQEHTNTHPSNGSDEQGSR